MVGINLKRDGFILSSLVSKDFKLKYRRSILGVLWSVLNPLLMMIVLSAVFSYFLKFGDVQNYPLYLILGNILFAFMTNSTTSGTVSIIESASLIKKIRINKMVFPFEKVLFELVNFAISLVAVVIVLLWFQILPTWRVIMLPILLVYMIMFCTGLSLILSSLAVFFRDVIHLWGIVTLAWTYLTPLFYPTSILSDEMMKIMNFNPMYHYVQYFRDIVLYGVTPDLKLNAICFGAAIVSLVIGLIVFNKSQKKFILYV